MSAHQILLAFLLLLKQCSSIEMNENYTMKCYPENGSFLSNCSEITNDITETNIQQLNSSLEANASRTIRENVTNAPQTNWNPEYPERRLPLAIIIAGPSAAIFVFLFLCIAFYFHNLQLNQKAARLSLTVYVTQDTGFDPDESEQDLPVVTKIETTPPEVVQLTRNLSVQSLRLSIDNSAQPPLHLARENSTQSMRLSIGSELFLPPRKSAMSLGLPSRGSTLSAFADQEIVNQSAKRKKHSIFFI
jgi:hypothetical protein